MGCCRRAARCASTARTCTRLDVEARVERGLCLVPEKRELFGELSGARQPAARRLSRAPLRGAALQQRAATRSTRASRAWPSGAQQRRHAVRRRAPDARARPRADVGAAPADARRAEPRPRAADRAARSSRSSRGLRDDGVSILLVEQNARAALESSDHGYVLETGEIALARRVARSWPRDPRVQATYLGGGRRDERLSRRLPARTSARCRRCSRAGAARFGDRPLLAIAGASWPHRDAAHAAARAARRCARPASAAATASR